MRPSITSVQRNIALYDSRQAPVPKARDHFLHSQPWQYGGHGRKGKLVSERMRRLARVLARFDRSGDCRSIFPSVATILAQLRAHELNYEQSPRRSREPWRYRMEWSRRTAFVYLDRLRAAGILTAAGLSTYHGTRRRALDPDRLLSAPRESCTPTRRESCTGSKALGSKKLHQSRRKRADTPDGGARNTDFNSKPETNSQDNPEAPRVGNGATKSAPHLQAWTIAELIGRPSNAIVLLNALKVFPEIDDVMAPAFLLWALRAVRRDPSAARKIFHPVEYVLRVVNNFLAAFPEWQRLHVLERFDGGIAGVQFDGQRWIESLPATRQPGPARKRSRPDDWLRGKNQFDGSEPPPTPEHRDKPSQRSRPENGDLFSEPKGEDVSPEDEVFLREFFTAAERRAFEDATREEEREMWAEAARVEQELAARVDQERQDLEARIRTEQQAIEKIDRELAAPGHSDDDFWRDSRNYHSRRLRRLRKKLGQ